MIKTRYISTKRDKNNRVLDYLLVDKNGVQKYIQKDKLKELIKSGKIQVENLTLTSDNRLVAKGKGKTQAAISYTGALRGKSLRTIVSQCGEEGYSHKGLFYWLEDNKVAVRAIDNNIESALILSGVEIIDVAAFEECEALTTVELPKGITELKGLAFGYCSSLRSMTIPDSVTSIGDEAFMYCESLTNIEIPMSVTRIGNKVFLECSSLVRITLPKEVKSIGNYAFSYCRSLISIEIPEGAVSIGEGAFMWCSSLMRVTIPRSVTHIGEDAFWDCKSLKFIKLPCRFKGQEKTLGLTENTKIKYY